MVRVDLYHKPYIDIVFEFDLLAFLGVDTVKLMTVRINYTVI